LLDGRARFRTALARWFAKSGKDYPWRRTHDPYAILVSEVMLQQTQIATVLGKGYYTRFLAAFPDLRALAAADDASLLKAWEGLGYYRRVRMLRETARAVLTDNRGVFPQDLEDLLKLPGVGPYTAGALRAFAFNLPAVLVDGNVARVLARLFDFAAPIDDAAGLRQIHEWAEALADPKRPRIHHAALMELGQTHCRPGEPDCACCPVERFCSSTRAASLPAKSRKTPVTKVTEHALWLRDARDRLLLHHERGQRRTGLWQLPTRDLTEIARLPVLSESLYSITRYRVSLIVHDGGTAGRGFRLAVDEAWRAPSELPDLALAAPFRRVIERLL